MAEKASRIVAGCSKEIAPVLKNLQLEARSEDGGSLRVIATDMDLAVLAKATVVDVQEPGDALMPAKKLLDIAKEASDGDLTVETSRGNAMISTATTRWDLQLVTDKYPPIPNVNGLTWTKVEAKQFMQALSKVRGAASRELARPELTLIHCSSDGVMASDGARMHLARVPISTPNPIDIQCGAADELISIMRRVADMQIGIAQTGSHIVFEIGNDIFLATKLNATWPDCRHILRNAENNKMELQVTRDELLSAIKRVRITADEETSRVNLSMQTDQMTISSRNKSGDTCSETLNVHWKNGVSVFSLNWTYLQDAASEMESPNIRLMFGEDVGKRKASVAVEEDNFIAVLNQLREEAAIPTK
jgi:DNA polymerase-3 subunit beta